MMCSSKILSSMWKLQYLNLSWFICLTETCIQWLMMANEGMSPEFSLHNVEKKIQKLQKMEMSTVYIIYVLFIMSHRRAQSMLLSLKY